MSTHHYLQCLPYMLHHVHRMTQEQLKYKTKCVKKTEKFLLQLLWQNDRLLGCFCVVTELIWYDRMRILLLPSEWHTCTELYNLVLRLYNTERIDYNIWLFIIVLRGKDNMSQRAQQP